MILTQSKGLDDKELENDVRGIIKKATAMMKAVRSRMQLSMSLNMKSRRICWLHQVLQERRKALRRVN